MSEPLYCHLNEDLVVKIGIISARGLRNADGMMSGKSDPYCICRVRGKKATEFQTVTKNDTLDPVWNLEKELTGVIGKGDILDFEVWDKDPVGSDALGKVSLPSERFLTNGFDGELELADAGKGISLALSRTSISSPPLSCPFSSGRLLSRSEPSSWR